MADGDGDSGLSREPRNFITREPVNPEDPESVRRWLQAIADEIARDENFDVTVEVVRGDDSSGQGDGDSLPGGPGGPVPASYKFDFNPCPGKHYVGGG